MWFAVWRKSQELLIKLKNEQQVYAFHFNWALVGFVVQSNIIMNCVVFSCDLFYDIHRNSRY